jgi:hypothetical protein
MMTDARFVKDADVELTFFKHSGISSYFAVAKGQGQRRSIRAESYNIPHPFIAKSLQPPALGPAHSGSSTESVTHSLTVSRLWELGAVRHSTIGSLIQSSN